MRELKYSTKAGKAIVERGSRWDGYTLAQVYNTWSQKKADAFNRCYKEYLDTLEHEAFGICSHNPHQFTCSWLGKKDGEDIMRYETKDNSYLVWLER